MSWVNILDIIYPIGSLYTSTLATSPASRIGGTWEPIRDRFLIGAGGSYSALATGGEAAHSLTVDEMPSHNHRLMLYNSGTGSSSSGLSWTGSGGSTSGYFGGGYMEYTGGSSAHNNMPPWYAVYIYRRIA